MKPTYYMPALFSLSLICMLPACKSDEKSTSSESSMPAAPEIPAAAAESPVAAVKKIAKLQNEMAAVMESITDPASAEAALPRVSPIAEQFAALGKQMKSMDGEMSPEVTTQLDAIMKPALERMQAAMTKAMPIISQNPDLAQRFQEALAKMHGE